MVRRYISEADLFTENAAAKVLPRLPAAIQPAPLRHGLVVELAPPLRTFHDPRGVALVTSAMERDGSLFLGSYRERSLVVVPLP